MVLCRRFPVKEEFQGNSKDLCMRSEKVPYKCVSPRKQLNAVTRLNLPNTNGFVAGSSYKNGG